MIKHRAIFDTNVLYAGLYSSTGASHQLLIRIENEDLVPILSTALLFEYEDVLKRNQKALGVSIRAIEDILNAICQVGEQQPIHFIWRPQLKDPKDDHILELAVAAGNADIVTHNTGDFKGSDRFGIRVIKPSLYLKEIK